MAERNFSRSRYIRVLLQIVRGVKEGVRITSFLRPVHDEVEQRVHSDTYDVMVLLQIITCVEQQMGISTLCAAMPKKVSNRIDSGVLQFGLL